MEDLLLCGLQESGLCRGSGLYPAAALFPEGLSGALGSAWECCPTATPQKKQDVYTHWPPANPSWSQPWKLLPACLCDWVV